MPIQSFGTAERSQFVRDGYLRLGAVIDENRLQALRDRINEIMLGRRKYDGMPIQLDSSTGDYADVPGASTAGDARTLACRRVDDLQRDPLFLSYMQHPLFGEITHELIGPDVSTFRAMFMNKPAQKGTHLPWHQDVGYGWGLDSDPEVTIWTALDAATVENGCMEVVPGSHRHGVINPMHFPSEEDQARYAPESARVYLEADAGEAILLNNLLLHRSGLNSTGSPRRAFSVAYMDAGTRNRKTGETYPFIFGRNALLCDACQEYRF